MRAISFHGIKSFDCRKPGRPVGFNWCIVCHLPHVWTGCCLLRGFKRWIDYQRHWWFIFCWSTNRLSSLPWNVSVGQVEGCGGEKPLSRSAAPSAWQIYGQLQKTRAVARTPATCSHAGVAESVDREGEQTARLFVILCEADDGMNA